MTGLSEADYASIDVLVAAAPPFPVESQRILAAILGPAYAEMCRKRAVANEAAAHTNRRSDAA